MSEREEIRRQGYQPTAGSKPDLATTKMPSGTGAVRPQVSVSLATLYILLTKGGCP